MLGAGNVRCGPPVLACIAAWQPGHEVEVCLFEPCEERLDLFDRFMRRCLEHTGHEHLAIASSDLLESCLGATDAVVCLHEEAARRMVGGEIQPAPEVWVEDEQGSSWHGDLNRPTPPDRLSKFTREMLARPAPVGDSRATVIEQAARMCAGALPNRARIASLMRGALLPPDVSHLQMAWPRALDPAERAAVPHQVLRWVHGDESLHSLFDGVAGSPFAAWLDSA